MQLGKWRGGRRKLSPDPELQGVLVKAKAQLETEEIEVTVASLAKKAASLWPVTEKYFEDYLVKRADAGARAALGLPPRPTG